MGWGGRLPSPPAIAVTGDRYENIYDGTLWRYDGTVWLPLSANPGCAHMYITAEAPTSLVLANTFYKLTGTTDVFICTEFTHSDNRLTLISPVTAKFSVTIAFSISSNKKDLVVTFELHKNSTEIIASRIRRTLRATGDLYLMAMASKVELAQDEYIELWGSSDVADTELTLHTMGFVISGS